MVETDEKGGHDHGWMTPEYLDVISTAIGNVKRVLEACGDEYTVIVTADHGGHDRGHGSDAREDMTIPLFFFGKRFTPGKQLEGVSILDIAPTIADIMSVPKAPEWEGKSLAE
jgi:phosphopentomutase